MKTLNWKLWRTIQSTRGQFLALATIIMLGMLIYIGMSTAYKNLAVSQQTFYTENNFADYNFQVVKAPAAVIKRIENVPGVIRATGRIQQDVSIIKPGNERATGRLTGYRLPLDREVNRLHLLTGRMFEQDSSGGKIDVLVEPQYAAANNLQPGDSISIVAGGKTIPLHVAGTAASPEFIYPIRDASNLMPEPDTFTIIMMEQHQVAQLVNSQGQINQIVVQLAPGADEEVVRKDIEKILEPYGLLASYPRKDQLSHAVLQVELDQLQKFSHSLPLIFFLIAAAIQFVILSRLIKSQRLQIGVMKALGYDNLRIIALYTGYALCVSLAGAVLGIGAGLLTASAMTNLYAQYFSLPQNIGGVNGQVVVLSVLISLAFGVSSGYLASRSVININPAEAMRSEAPVTGSKIILEEWHWLWQRLDSTWKMSLRSIFRNRIRFTITVLGVMSAVIILVLASFFNDAIDYMMKQNFKEVNRYDYMVRFNRLISQREVLYWGQWDEVTQMEPMLEIPVDIIYKGNVEEDLLVGMDPAGNLKGIFNQQGEPLSIPEDGVLISERTAQKLGVQVGDQIMVKTKLTTGPARTARLKVWGRNDQLLGQGANVSLETANQVLEEGRVISAVMLKVEPGDGLILEERFNEMTGVSSVLSRQKEQQNFEEMLDSSMAFIWIMMLLGGVLGLVIIYNSSIMTFNERSRELASLRIMGFSQREVSSLLIKETWFQAATGILLGLPAGRAVGAAYVASVSTDFFSFPVIIYPRTYLIASLSAVVFVLIGLWFVTRRVKELDMLEVLKNRD